MFGETWKTSERKYGVVVERDVWVTMRDGTRLHADVFRPDSDETFPAIFGFHPYHQAAQTAPIRPGAFPFKHPGVEKNAGYIESGDPHFYVRRGYAHVIANIRGTGKSEGKFPFLSPPEARDGCDMIEWIARQPWCNGHVGMFGVSYFGWIQLFIASLNPPHLKCLFAPWAATDIYRDVFYRGGILGHGFARLWAGGSVYRCRPENHSRRVLGEDKFREALERALQDEDIGAVPELVQILRNPDAGTNSLVTDLLLNPEYGPYWEERTVRYDSIQIPAYIGACWGNYGLHLPGAFRSWANLNVPKKMIIGPPAYLDRPLHQLQFESLRWFDYWLKGIDTKIMDEPPIRLFVMGTNDWKEATAWPLPGTKWTPFYLHENGLLLEREHWPNEGSDSFEDSPWGRGSLEYCSPRLVENTEVIGPIVLNLYASTTDREVLWFISLREVDSEGNERVLTRGWLRGSHREVDPERSKPWAPFHPHARSEPLLPGKIYEFNIPVVPTGNLFRAGSRIKLKIACTDDPPKHHLEAIASGHLWRQSPSQITVYHNADYPSHLILPITRGNILGTFMSGGRPYL